jgi:hypothetical protein
MMDPFFLVVESSAFSTWLRESPSLLAFPFVLILHTVGLAFLVGTSVAIALRTLGLAASIPLISLKSYLSVMWLGFWVNAISGVALLAAYPTKALTNPLFYVKLTLIGVALATIWPALRYIRGERSDATPQRRLKLAAAVSLLCWTASITAGRFLAYTYTRLTVNFP